jgi:cytochrome c peroxidase
LQKTTGLTSDKGKFKAPTLRNIALTAPYMHDGRFNTLEEVLEHYNEHIQPSATLDPLVEVASNLINPPTLGLHLDEQEKKDLIAFLKTLTDSSLLANPDFSSPF